jgi:hypothetical protein
MYARMGLADEGIIEETMAGSGREYVDLALRLTVGRSIVSSAGGASAKEIASDRVHAVADARERRQQLSMRILATKHLLYEDERAVVDWGNALDYAALPSGAKQSL